MIALLIVIHVICSLGLIVIVLLQAGKGAGLASTFGAQAVESALGAGASDFLKKVTTVMAVIFMLTSLSLAFVTARKSASVVKNINPQLQQAAQEQTKQAPKEVLPGLQKKSKKELQNILNKITESLPLGAKKESTKDSSSGAAEVVPASIEEKAADNTSEVPNTSTQSEVSVKTESPAQPAGVAEIPADISS